MAKTKLFFGNNEGYFDVHGNVDKQDMPYYAAKNLTITQANLYIAPYVTVWCVLSVKLIIGPYFVEEEELICISYSPSL